MFGQHFLRSLTNNFVVLEANINCSPTASYVRWSLAKQNCFSTEIGMSKDKNKNCRARQLLTIYGQLVTVNFSRNFHWKQWLLFCVLTWSIALAVICYLTMTFEPPHKPEDEVIRKRSVLSFIIFSSDIYREVNKIPLLTNSFAHLYGSHYECCGFNGIGGSVIRAPI